MKGFIFVALTLFLLFYKLDQFPAVWWDEGWTLDVARNWVENGHLGHYLDGEAIPPRIPVRLTSVIPVALSFKLFGIGIWQGRLPGALFTLASLGMLYYLTASIYHRRIANGSLFVLYVLSIFFFNPILYGRQVLAEMPMLFYLLAGYTFFWLSLTRSSWWILAAGLFWGIGLHSKFQVFPFWAISLGLALAWGLLRRQGRKIAMIAFGMGIAAILYWGIRMVQNSITPPTPEDEPLWEILFNTVVFTWDGSVRSKALSTAFTLGLPALIGFVYGGWQIFAHSRFAAILKITPSLRPSPNISQAVLEDCKGMMILVLWGLGASWFAWYVFMGMYWHRYLFPPFFFGSIFASVFLYQATAGFNVRLTILNASSLFLKRQIHAQNLSALLVMFLFGFAAVFGIVGFQGLTQAQLNVTPLGVSRYIQEQIPSQALIETFESELFFTAPHRYHFPSDLVSMQQVRKLEVDANAPVDYDPFAAGADYLIVGGYNKAWHLYDEVLQSGAFELEIEFPGYQVFHKVIK